MKKNEKSKFKKVLKGVAITLGIVFILFIIVGFNSLGPYDGADWEVWMFWVGLAIAIVGYVVIEVKYIVTGTDLDRDQFKSFGDFVASNILIILGMLLVGFFSAAGVVGIRETFKETDWGYTLGWIVTNKWCWIIIGCITLFVAFKYGLYRLMKHLNPTKKRR